MIRNVAIFCASAAGLNPVYQAVAEQLGQALAIANRADLWRVKCRTDEDRSQRNLGWRRQVIGVIPEVLVDLEIAHHGVKELHVTSTMHSRKAMMAEKADAFIALPGGFGTLRSCSKFSRGAR